MVFYRKYRPQKFSDVSGQDHVVETLLGQLESGKIGHGYLFWGPRGTGKTSMARIFAKAVNCEVFGKRGVKNKKLEIKFGEPCNRCINCLSIADGSSLDLIEIDAASNRGIDEIRDLREKVKLSPVFSRFKVYIIDEAHMLTTEAFNALLKTLEEPPGHAIFILCTTELGKLPPTIVSRLQRFNFARASSGEISKRLLKIAKEEGIKIRAESALAIAEAADGSFRDADSILDQLGASKKLITPDDVSRVAKVSGWNQLFKFASFLANDDLKSAVIMIEEIADIGGDLAAFGRQTVLFLEKLLFLTMGIEGEVVRDFDNNQLQQMKILAQMFGKTRLLDLMRLLLISENEMKLYPLAQVPLVLAVSKYCGSSAEDNDQGGEQNQENDLQPPPRLDTKTSVIKKPAEAQIRKNVPGKKIGRRSQETLLDVEKNWTEFLNRVKKVNAHVVALLKSTRPAGYDGSLLTLEVFYRFHKQKLEEPKILKMLDEHMGEVIGKPVSFKFVLAQRESKPTKAVVASNVVDIKESELEKIAQEIFSK